MATLLQEEQWELDGFLFGEGTRFRLAPDLDFGSADIRPQDAPRPQFDGDLFGRDTLGGPELSFVFTIRDGLDVWPQIDAFRQAWRAGDVHESKTVSRVQR